MKQRTLIIVISLVVLSTLACSLTEGGIGTGEEADAIATQPPAESSGEQLPLPSEPIDLVTGQIPEGYPEEEIPIYEPASSVILGGVKKDMGDSLFCTLVIGSNDDMQTISQDIQNKLENDSTEFSNMGEGMLIGVKGEWEYVITMNSGEADGYETMVTYTLTKRQ